MVFLLSLSAQHVGVATPVERAQFNIRQELLALAAEDFGGGVKRVGPSRAIGEQHAEYVERAAAIDETKRARARWSAIEPAQRAQHRFRARMRQHDPGKTTGKEEFALSVVRAISGLKPIAPGAEAARLQERGDAGAASARPKTLASA